VWHCNGKDKFEIEGWSMTDQQLIRKMKEINFRGHNKTLLDWKQTWYEQRRSEKSRWNREVKQQRGIWTARKSTSKRSWSCHLTLMSKVNIAHAMSLSWPPSRGVSFCAWSYAVCTLSFTTYQPSVAAGDVPDPIGSEGSGWEQALQSKFNMSVSQSESGELWTQSFSL
jgi:hypothetical protein